MEDLSQYNAPGTLLRLAQLRMIDILKAIDDICKRHNITYWLDGGTMLGCARHKGFIPWDDDLDIAIFEEDYKQLLFYLETELPDQFKLLHHGNNKHFPYTFAKVVDTKSYVNQSEPWSKKTGLNGLWVDIFPMAKCSGRIRSFVEPVYGRCVRHLRGFDDKTLSHIGAFLLYPFALALRGISEVLCLFISDDKYTNTYGQGNLSQQNSTRRRSWTVPTIEMPFEGMMFPMPCNYDAMLTAMYGNYMQLPPPEKRIVHLNGIKIFDA